MMRNSGIERPSSITGSKLRTVPVREAPLLDSITLRERAAASEPRARA